VPGSIGRGGCLQGLTDALVFPTAWPLQIALYDDLLNALLHAVWKGGGLAFPIDPTALAPGSVPPALGDAVLDVDFLLPPIVTACGADGALHLQVGDVHVAAILQVGPLSVPLDVYASLDALASVVVGPEGPDGATVGLVVSDIVDAAVDVVADDDAALGIAALVEQLVADELLPGLVDTLGAGALGGFPVPALDLSAAPNVPPGTTLQLDLTDVGRQDGYTLLQGDTK